MIHSTVANNNNATTEGYNNLSQKTRDDDTEDISKFPMLYEGLEGLDISC